MDKNMEKLLNKLELEEDIFLMQNYPKYYVIKLIINIVL